MNQVNIIILILIIQSGVLLSIKHSESSIDEIKSTLKSIYADHVDPSMHEIKETAKHINEVHLQPSLGDERNG